MFPEIVNVPDVLIVKLFLITPVPLQVPVPLILNNVVPNVVVLELVSPPLIFNILPFIVTVVPFNVKRPVRLRFEDNVIVYVPEPNVILFQIIPFVASVVETLIFKVDPVVTTVPAVYVKIPVL